MKLQPEQMNYVPDCPQKSLTHPFLCRAEAAEAALTRLFWDGLFDCVFQFLFCLMIKFLISAVRVSRLLPKFISAANNVHFSASLHFKSLNRSLGSIGPANLVACHPTAR
jgi:hypothetical protein